jgi:hypothetical protein
MDVGDYGTARGSAGMTGASARDFANQAQGLGGLVRLYATYAANIFAVGAAFRALSTAMDTANMVKGLDQLGAASGVALGSLSKNLAKATGGAISLREAMEATAKASSSGMSSDQIMRMGKVAQQASQALGVDMSDAISRISRGITKLEPELLDELGLFTKTGMAAEAYAKSVGKSTSELTDFERRAAFANAVLAEGERKFSSINLDVNPYTKLLASIKDLAQVSLEFVNKGLAPIVSYLSNSPTALGVAIAALGSILVKQALPAIGEFKAGLASAAEGANQLAIQKAEDAGKARLAIDADILKKVESMADDKVAAVDAAEQKIQALEASNINKRSAAYKLLQKDIADVTDADISAVEARAKAAEKSGDLQRATAYREVTSAVMEHKKAEDDLIVTKQQLSKQLEKDATSMTTYGMTVRAAEQAQTAATKANIVSNAAYNGSLIGTTAAMAMMRTEMQAAGIATNTFSGKLLLARGALMAFAGQVSTLMAALGPIMLIITGISLAFSLLDGALSDNSKESAELSSALDALDSNAQHLGKTIDVINEKPFLERMSPESLKVKATALAEVSTAISSTVKGLISADKAASGWDNLLDSISSLWGGDMLSKASKGLTSGIVESLSSIAGSPEAKAINKELSSILKIDTETASFQEIQDAIKKIGRESPEKLKLVEEGFKKVSMAAQVSAAKGTELVDSFKKLADIKQTISNKFLPTDDITKFGQELVATSQKLSIALNDPQQKLNAIVSLAANGVNIPGATLEQVSALTEAAKLAKSIQETEARQLDNKQKLIDKEAELAQLVGKERAAAIAAGKQVQVSGLTIEGQKALKELKKDLQALKSTSDVNIRVKTELTAKLDEYSEVVQKANLDTFKAGADLVAKQINAEFIKAGKVVSDAYTSIIGETEGTIKLRAQSEKAVISAQIEQIKSQRDLTIATRELSLRLEKEALEVQKQATYGNEDRGAVAKRMTQVDTELAAVNAAKSGDFSKLNLSTNVNDLKTLNVEANNFANNMRSSAAAIANLGAQIKAIDIKALDATTKLLFETAKTALGEKEKSISLSKQELDIQGKVVSQGNMSYIAAKNAVEGKVLALQQEVALLNIAAEIARNVAILNSNASKDVKKEASAKIASLHIDIERLATQQAQQKGILAATQAQEKLAAQAFNAEEARKREQETLSLTLAKKDEHLKREQDLFNLYSSIGILTEKDKINQQFLLDKKKAELDYEEKIAQTKASRGSDMAALNAREENVWEQLGSNTGNEAALLEELHKIAALKATITSRTEEEIAASGRVKDTTIGIAEAIKQAAKEQLEWNETFAEIESFSSSLKTAFEGGSEALSLFTSGFEDLASTVTNAAKSEKEYAKQIQAKQKAIDSTTDPSEQAALIEDLISLEKKKSKSELTNAAAAAGAAKKMFKEKTLAHKAFAAAEKIIHLAKLAMTIKEMVTDTAHTGSSIANSIARTGAAVAEAGVDGIKAVVKAIASMPFPLNLVAGVATAAVVGSLLSQIGGKKPSAGGGGGFAPSAEQQQEVQGTAMGWDSSGNKVQVRRGVFGDTDAKSESITNSLEIIRDNSIAGLSYDNKMLKALEAIERAISGVSKAAYRVSGLRTGDLFGTQTGVVRKGGGFLGTGLFGSKTSANVADTGILISGTFDQLSKGLSDSALQFYETVNYTKKKWYGSKKSWTETNRMAISAAQGGAELSAAIGGVFAESRNLINEIAAEAKMSQTTVDQILSTVKYDTQRLSTQGLRGEALKQEINSVISSMLDDATVAVFSSFEEYAEFGEGLLQTVVRVIDTNKKVKQALRNVGAQDIETSIRAISPSMADEDVAQASFRITENLTNLSGGIEEFVERSTFFTDNFLTEELRLAPIREAVNTEMARIAKLGYTSADGLVDTKREFAELIGTLDLTQPAAQAVYVSLMDVAEGFSEVYEGTEALESSIEYYLDKLRNQKRTNEDIANSIFDMENDTKKLNAELLKAQGNLTGYKQAIIDIETEGFHPLELAVYLSNQAIKDQIEALNKQEQASKDAANGLNSLLNQVVSLGNYSEDFRLQYTRNQALDKTVDALKPLQNYVFALEDVKTATTKSAEAKAAYEAVYLSALDAEIGKQKEYVNGLKDTQKALKGFISSIRDFSSSLKLGTESILTPLEKYTLAQSKFQEILTTSLTSQDKELREQALGQLEGAASEFLSASREINASSIGYANDFNVVTDALSQLEGALGGQLTDTESALLIAESQLAVMEAQKSSLQEIAQTLDQAYTIWVTAESSLATIKLAANLALESAIAAGDTKTAEILSVGAFAKGGLAQGWSLVGENGPELVDFATPGRVYTAEDTFSGFNNSNNELVDLVQELTNEVKKLREQQNKETGALINATYDSQNKNSDKVVSAITDSSAEEIWQLKVSSGAKLV